MSKSQQCLKGLFPHALLLSLAISGCNESSETTTTNIGSENSQKTVETQSPKAIAFQIG